MTYKESTHKKLLDIYKSRGAKTALTLANDMLCSRKYADDIEFKRELHGELCETVLEIIIRAFCDKHPEKTKGWILSKGLILKDRAKTDGEFVTELDLTLFTRACVFLFECKSYGGAKKLIEEGKLVRNGSVVCDVYRQSLLHKRTIEPWIEDFVLGNTTPVVQMCMFDFSNGGFIDDARSRAAKLELPCLDVSSVLSYISGFSDSVWDLEILAEAVKQLEKVSDGLRAYHLQYVRSISHK